MYRTFQECAQHNIKEGPLKSLRLDTQTRKKRDDKKRILLRVRVHNERLENIVGLDFRFRFEEST